MYRVSLHPWSVPKVSCIADSGTDLLSGFSFADSGRGPLGPFLSVEKGVYLWVERKWDSGIVWSIPRWAAIQLWNRCRSKP